MEIPFEGGIIDSIDLKAMLVSRGVKVAARVYRKFGGTVRLFTDPLTCNTVIFPDGTIVQLTDLAFHMAYIRSAMSWDMLKQVRYLSEMKTPFRLDLDSDGLPALWNGPEKLVNVTFPPATAFYNQKTRSGLPFIGNAVLQGLDWLSFQLLWKCDYACAGEPCQYCYSGGELHNLKKKKKPMPVYPTPEDVADIVEYAMMTEKQANSLQITGGSTFNVSAECDRILAMLEAIDRRVGRANIPGEILIYTTPPADPSLVDPLFAAGADRLSMSLEIWDEQLAARIMPGKMRFTGRQRHLDALDHVVEKHGRGRACSNFIIGLEPAESMLEGAEFVAARGIVPIASVWIPFGRPVLGSMRAPGLDYYRKVKEGLARIYLDYGLIPPGAKGLNVCMCRDIYLNYSDKAQPSDGALGLLNEDTPAKGLNARDIRILGADCDACRVLERNTRNVVRDLALTATVTRIDDIFEIMAAGIVATPTLMIDGRVVTRGRVPEDAEIRQLLSQ